MAQFTPVLTALTSTPLPCDPVAIVDELRDLETLKCAAEARQARLAAALDAIRTAEDQTREIGAPGGPAVHAEVAFARRVSVHQGKQLLSLARILDRELPHTKAAFDQGLISQWRVTVIARETACLSAEHRATVDEALASDPVALSHRGTGRSGPWRCSGPPGWTRPRWPGGVGTPKPVAGSRSGRPRTRWST